VDTTKIDRLRLVGKIEGVSYLLLLGIAMPLKYYAGIPEAVKLVGWLHGALFVAFCLSLMQVWTEHGWPWSRCAMVFIASLVPFGPFLIDGRFAAWIDENDV
jgi:integral membrane protein